MQSKKQPNSHYYVQSDTTGEHYLQQRLEIVEKDGTHVLGDQIAVDGDMMVVGGDGDNDVNILTRNDDTWSEVTNITAPKGTNRNSFGWQVPFSERKSLYLLGKMCFSTCLKIVKLVLIKEAAIVKLKQSSLSTVQPQFYFSPSTTNWNQILLGPVPNLI